MEHENLITPQEQQALQRFGYTLVPYNENETLKQFRTMNEAKNIQKPTKKAWSIAVVVCRFFGHKYRLKKHITPYLREIKCTRCKQEFGMNDHTQSVLPLDNELREVHSML